MAETQTASVTFTREELYEQVWSQPMRRLAPTYELSDVGLAKICRKLQIPTPPVGYWRKKEFGYEVERPPLPELDDQQDFSIELNKAPHASNLPLSEVDVLIQTERQSEQRIVVPEGLEPSHPLVKRTEGSLRSAKPDADGLVKPRAKGCLDICVGPLSIERATRISDALIKALESRGFPVTPQDQKSGLTQVEVLSESITFRLEEILDKKERELTAAQKRDREQYSWLASRKPEYDYFPSGRLSLLIGESSGGRGTRRRWSDGQKHQLENMLNRFVAGLIKAADDEKEARRDREEWQRRFEEDRRRRHDAEIERKEAEARVKNFEVGVAAWSRANDFRQFVEAVRVEAVRRHGLIDEESEVGQWLDWADRCISAIDPLDCAKPLPAYSVTDEIKERWRKELDRGW